MSDQSTVPVIDCPGHTGKRLRGRVSGRRTTAMRQDWLRKRIKQQKNLCAICGVLMRPVDDQARRDLAATLDHLIALAKGGSDHWENVRAVHKKCNAEKGST